jgi:2-polyprenyl-3-methyl-5-hydroxy-6-metoxy-1,4-benzoquinol methylase
MTESNFEVLMARITAQRPSHAKFVNSAMAALTPDEIAEAAKYISYLLEHNDLDFLTTSYLTILDDTKRAQIDFMRDKKYQFSSFAEVADSVYFNKDYMTRYMIGLALTEFVWPNHIQIRRFFERTLPSRPGGKYLEVGPGHGAFLVHAMQKSAMKHFVAVDISATSIALTDDVVRRQVPERRDQLELRECNFLGQEALSGPFDVLVMGEVLEHVEQPELFLRRLNELGGTDPHIFVTTCINAPAVDHIYLFRNESEIAELIKASGLSIRDQLVVPYSGQSLKRCVDEDLPINVAYVLGR